MNEVEITQFTQFYYPELKDLLLKFLTLVTTVFTLSMVFAEKFVIGNQRFSSKHTPILLSWILFFFAIAAGGYALYQLFIAAEIAHGEVIYKYNMDLKDLVRSVYRYSDIGGLSFGFGLIGLAISAFVKLLTVKKVKME